MAAETEETADTTRWRSIGAKIITYTAGKEMSALAGKFVQNEKQRKFQ